MNKQQAEQVEKTALEFEARLKKFDYYGKTISIFDKIGTAFYMAPASSREEYHYCYSGGLARHSLNVADNILKVANGLCPGKYSDNKLTTLALIHDIGKAGDGENELYIWNESDWHQSRGIMYELNTKCSKMTVQDRTLFLLQKFGISLDMDDYLAIKLCEMKAEEIPDVYRYNEPSVSLLLSMANKWSINETV